MPRGKKKKVIVVIGPNGQIIKHKYHNNHRNVEKTAAVGKSFDPRSKKHVTAEQCKIKDEKHSS